MKNIEQIKDEVAQASGHKDWEEFTLELALSKNTPRSSITKISVIENFMTMVAKRYAEQALEQAAEKMEHKLKNYNIVPRISKSLILNIKNKLK